MSDPDRDESIFDDLVADHLRGHQFNVGATRDREALYTLWELSHDLAANFGDMLTLLRALKPFSSYEAAEVFVSGLLRDQMHVVLHDLADPILLLRDVALAKDILAAVARRYAKDPKRRDRALSLAQDARIEDVALPIKAGARWDYTGWRRGLSGRGLHRHPSGRRRQLDTGVPPLSTIAELRELLGIASPSQLGFMLLASDRSELKPYTTFTIPKKRGGEPRLIAAPGLQLRLVQRRILDLILGKLPVHEAAHGFVPGRSTVTNATPHVGKALLIKFDLEDFFGTITYWRVVGLFASMGYAVGQLHFAVDDDHIEVAPTLARLCCYAQRRSDNRGRWRVFTPQGAPTSPAISNLVCRTLDARLTGLATTLGGHYTRYADDLTFSFDRTPPRGVGRFRWWVNQICHQEGFFVREDKFRVIRASQQQRVTGLVVNEGVAIPRKERRRFRAIVHNCERFGLASQARGREDFASYLLGYASYLRMVHPDEGADMLRRVQALVREQGTSA